MKKFLSVIVIFALCLSMVSCSSDNKKKDKKDKDKTRQEETEEIETTKETDEETTEEILPEIPEEPVLEFISNSISFDSYNISAPDSSYTSLGMYYEHIEIDDSSYSSLRNAVSNEDSVSYNELYDEYITCLDQFVESNYDNSNSGYIYRFSNIYRADSMVFSYLISADEGLHSSYTSTFYAHNINSTTGEEIPLISVVNIDAFRPVLFTYMEQSGDIDAYRSDWQDYVNEQIDMGTLVYTIAPDGIYVFFQNSDLAENGNWISKTSFKIPYINNEPVFTATYFNKITENYCLYLDTNNELYYDLDNDGDLEYLCVNAITGSYGDFESFECICNENTISFDTFGYSLKGYVTHINDRNFLYVTCVEDNDYRINYIFEIADDELTYVGDFAGSTYRIVNPEEFYCSRNLNPLSTVTGYSLSTTDSDGTIILNDVFDIRTTIKLTNTVELEGQIISPDGTATGETRIIPVFSEFNYYQTDNETYVDFKIYNADTDSFDIVRFSVNLNWENGQQIENMPASECFATLYYAG